VEIRKIFKQGRTLAVTIPKQIRVNLGLSPGDYVSIELTVDRKVQIQKAKIHEQLSMPCQS
jgi:AbrB family looped-hinge helix DNA binding protein